MAKIHLLKEPRKKPTAQLAKNRRNRKIMFAVWTIQTILTIYFFSK